MREVSTAQRAKAQIMRGLTYYRRRQLGDLDLAIADYTAVIDMPETPADQRATAHINRAAAFGSRGQVGDMHRAIRDYTAAAEMTDAPAELRARARALLSWRNAGTNDPGTDRSSSKPKNKRTSAKRGTRSKTKRRTSR
jgi:hypothetical protein